MQTHWEVIQRVLHQMYWPKCVCMLIAYAWMPPETCFESARNSIIKEILHNSPTHSNIRHDLRASLTFIGSSTCVFKLCRSYTDIIDLLVLNCWRFCLFVSFRLSSIGVNMEEIDRASCRESTSRGNGRQRSLTWKAKSHRYWTGWRHTSVY